MSSTNDSRQSSGVSPLLSSRNEGGDSPEAPKETSQDDSKTPRKTHCTTVCLVPTPNDREAWEALTEVRTQLRDPGLFRWPPHVNILYPFLELTSGDEEESIVQSLRNVTKQYEPFEVTLSSTGCFGGKNRGVLWLYPESTTDEVREEAPLIQMQRDLQRSFPMCYEQRKQGAYSPHMTLSHFASLPEAQDAENAVNEQWKPISFLLKEIYVLSRAGDDGQFLIHSVIPLGGDVDTTATEKRDVVKFCPPKPFPFMPLVEEDWVREERMKMKERRNNSGRRRRPRGQKSRNADDPRGKSRSRDTPEVIAAKRAARKTKRERLEREAAAASNRDTIPES